MRIYCEFRMNMIRNKETEENTMSLRTQIIVAVAVIIALLALSGMIKKKKIEVRYALIWYLLALVILVLDIFPGLLDKATAFMGVGLAVNMLFFMGFCFALVIIFVMTLWVSRLSVKVKKLTQELALLDKKLSETDLAQGKD